MKLRALELKDAPLMLEWMHDDSVTKHLAADFNAKQLSDCEKFIEMSKDTSSNLHLAITDDNDTYMGTVSLKNIHDSIAEFAITVRSVAMGNGYSIWGMTEIIKKGFNEMNLDAVYWCVSKQNARAVRFYDKNGYERTTDVPDSIKDCYTEEQQADFYWYKVVAI